MVTKCNICYFGDNRQLLYYYQLQVTRDIRDSGSSVTMKKKYCGKWCVLKTNKTLKNEHTQFLILWFNYTEYKVNGYFKAQHVGIKLKIYM